MTTKFLLILPTDLHKKVKKKAKDSNLSLSAYLRLIIKHYLDKPTPPIDLLRQ